MKIRALAGISALLALLAAGCGDNTTLPNEAVLGGSARPGGPAPGAEDSCGGLPIAPPEARVDLYQPEFSDPTAVDNPLFPIAELSRVVLLGKEDGEEFRSETTLLAKTNTITVDGQKVTTLVSQYVAWVDGQIHEVALDWYAQDDLGAVWYLGEDVSNYEDGVIGDTEGTWLAGRDGPMAMIMPADPQDGDVWRPENACPIVFEEVTALATGVTVQGPRGPVHGALVVRELHMDLTLEDKTFAPGYGEFSTGSGANVEALAVAVPTDFLGGPVPPELETLEDGAEEILDAIPSGDWDAIGDLAEEMRDAWKAYRTGGVPPLLEDEMESALDDLDDAIDAEDGPEAQQATIPVAIATLDFLLQYESREEIDRDLIEVWQRQLTLDRAAGDQAAVRGDLATIGWIRYRLNK